MALERPTPVESLEPIEERAVALASDVDRIRLVKFQARMGAAIVGAAVALFVGGHLRVVVDQMVGGFAERAYDFSWWLLLIGVAFAGPEVARSWIEIVKAVNR